VIVERWVYISNCVNTYSQVIDSMDAKEIATIVMNMLPDMAEMDEETFTVKQKIIINKLSCY
jgi:hypothetical protein